MKSMRDIARDLLHALWERVTDSTRRDICTDCRCPIREDHR